MLSLSCASYIKGTRGQTLGWAEVQFSFLTRLTSGLTSDVDPFGCHASVHMHSLLFVLCAPPPPQMLGPHQYGLIPAHST